MLKLQLCETPGKTPVLVVPLFDGGMEKEVKEVNTVHGEMISRILELKDFEPKAGKLQWVYSDSKEIPRLLLVGLGKKKDLDIRAWKQAVGAALLQVQAKKQSACALLVTAGLVKKFGAKTLGQETAIALDLANYSFDHHKEVDARVKPVKQVQVILEKKSQRAFTAAAKEGRHIAEGANFTRHLGNTPPSIMTPKLLAKEVQDTFKGAANTSVKVLGRAEAKKLGMGCFLGVAQGSELEPKFIIVEYKGGKSSEKPTVLVGKGITYDSGGLSLKPSQFMSNMKFDMLGAATVAGVLKAAVNLKLKKNLVGLMPACENMPSGSSFRPDDILTAMNGKTVLVDNTDAEGRLILSDALCYAHRYEPKEVIDFATLTGACVVAIGENRSGLFSPVDNMAARILKHAEETGEWLWRLPLGKDFTEQMKSPIADYKNISSSRYGGASTAAAFLQFFTLDKEGNAAFPWAHVDLSSAYIPHKGKPYSRGGATGVCVQTMVSYLR